MQYRLQVPCCSTTANREGWEALPSANSHYWKPNTGGQAGS